jgi:hypothetical protein
VEEQGGRRDTLRAAVAANGGGGGASGGLPSFAGATSGAPAAAAAAAIDTAAGGGGFSDWPDVSEEGMECSVEDVRLLMGFVPQDDLLHETLTVHINLGIRARQQNIFPVFLTKSSPILSLIIYSVMEYMEHPVSSSYLNDSVCFLVVHKAHIGSSWALRL